MRVYSIKRPVDIGTYPKNGGYQVLKIKNFEKKDYVPEIDKEAWGYIDYKENVPETILQKYELCSQEYVISNTWEMVYKAFSLANLHEKGPKETAIYLSRKVSSQKLKNCFAIYIQIKNCKEKISEENRKWLEGSKIKKKVAESSILSGLKITSIQPINVNQLIEELRKI